MSYQYLSSQIKGFIEIAEKGGKTFVLIISEGTKLSKPLIDAIDAVGGKIIRFGEGIKMTPFIMPIDLLNKALNPVYDQGR